MTRAWKPGDVALIPFARGDIRAIFTTDGWAISDAPDVRGIREFSDVRPLVVIDPEDREQVERLAKSMHESDHIAPWSDLHNETRSQIEDAMQGALREFANSIPPKPEEPMGLGAVVATEADGDFIRISSEFQTPWLDVQLGTHRHWDAVPAIRVLSEGVAA